MNISGAISGFLSFISMCLDDKVLSRVCILLTLKLEEQCGSFGIVVIVFSPQVSHIAANAPTLLQTKPSMQI